MADLFALLAIRSQLIGRLQKDGAAVTGMEKILSSDQEHVRIAFQKGGHDFELVLREQCDKAESPDVVPLRATWEGGMPEVLLLVRCQLMQQLERMGGLILDQVFVYSGNQQHLRFCFAKDGADYEVTIRQAHLRSAQANVVELRRKG